jgi:hypothetical protein
MIRRGRGFTGQLFEWALRVVGKNNSHEMHAVVYLSVCPVKDVSASHHHSHNQITSISLLPKIISHRVSLVLNEAL